MQRRICVMLLLLSLELGGCSAVRGVGFHCLGMSNSPLPPDGQRVSFQSFPFYSMGDPVVYTTIRSSQRADAILAFYRAAFLQRGWTEDEATRKKGPPMHHDGVVNVSESSESYNFARQSILRVGNGRWTYARERIELSVRDQRLHKEPAEMTEVGILVSGHYAWDEPSAWAAHGIQRLIGGEQSLWVTMPF